MVSSADRLRDAVLRSSRPGGKGKTDIDRCAYKHGACSAPENLGDAINTAAEEYEAFVTPDERTMILTARATCISAREPSMDGPPRGISTRPSTRARSRSDLSSAATEAACSFPALERWIRFHRPGAITQRPCSGFAGRATDREIYEVAVPR